MQAEQQPLALIVDDEEAQRLMLRSFLELKGWQVQEAEDGSAGLSVLNHLQPRVVLLDLNMPVMDGYRFLTSLRQHPSRSRLPVIVVTAQRLTQEQRNLLNQQQAAMVEKGDFPSLSQLLKQL